MIHPNFFNSLSDNPYWPPLPHPLTQLFLSQQENWGIEEWKQYSAILEIGGHYLREELIDTKEKLRISEEKKSRSKKLKTPKSEDIPALLPGQSLLGSARMYALRFTEDKPKLGRKPGSQYRKLAMEVIKKRAEMEAEANGKQVTDQDALVAVYQEKGLGGWRGYKNRSVHNEISKIRNETNTKKRFHKN